MHTLAERTCVNLPGWEGFPISSSWAPFDPQLDVSLQLTSNNCVSRWFFATFGTPRLDVAVRHIAQNPETPIQYWAAPAHRVEQMEGAYGSRIYQSRMWTGPLAADRHMFAYELDWPLVRRGKNRPERLHSPTYSNLYREEYGAHSYFMLYRTPRRIVRLLVGGANSGECVRAWTRTAAWIRAKMDEPATDA